MCGPRDHANCQAPSPQAYDRVRTTRSEPDLNATITYAGYGIWNSVLDATEEVQRAYAAGTRVFFARNDWVGDPSPNKPKCLMIVWRLNGSTCAGVVAEGDPNGIVVP